MMSWKLGLVIAICSVFWIPLEVSARTVRSELVQQLIDEAEKRGLKIDESKIVTQSEGDNEYAAVPLITDSKLSVTSEQIKNGEVYTTFQCTKTKQLNGCYPVRITGFNEEKKSLITSLVGENDKIISSTELESSSTQTAARSERLILVIYEAVDVYIDGEYYGSFYWIIIICCFRR